MAPKKVAKRKAKAKAGPLAGKVQGLLPPSLEAAPRAPEAAAVPPPAAADAQGSDDDAPEEVQNLPSSAGAGAAAASDGAAEAVGAAAAAPPGRPRAAVRRGAKAPDASSRKYFWQDSGSDGALAAVREEDVKRRRPRERGMRVEKDGVILVPAAGHATDPLSMSASEFVTAELFERRKRTRTLQDRNDRNVLGKKAGAHLR